RSQARRQRSAGDESRKQNESEVPQNSHFFSRSFLMLLLPGCLEGGGDVLRSRWTGNRVGTGCFLLEKRNPRQCRWDCPTRHLLAARRGRDRVDADASPLLRVWQGPAGHAKQPDAFAEIEMGGGIPPKRSAAVHRAAGWKYRDRMQQYR